MPTITEEACDKSYSCSRERYWSELSDKKRMERLRTVLKQKSRIIDELMVKLRRLNDQMERHEHSTFTGKSVIPTQNPNHFNEVGRVIQEKEGDDCYI